MILGCRVFGDEEAIDGLQDLADRARNMRPATRVSREILRAGLKKNAESKGAYFGDSWPPNSPSVQFKKGSAGDRTLEWTGALLTALKGGKGKRGSATKKTASAGVNIFYARFHQAPAEHLPERRVVGVSTGDRRQIVRVVKRYYHRGIL